MSINASELRKYYYGTDGDAVIGKLKNGWG